MLALAAFAAGFIDSVVGGGGLIQIPALFTMLPQRVAGDAVWHQQVCQRLRHDQCRLALRPRASRCHGGHLAGGPAAFACSYLGAWPWPSCRATSCGR